MPSNRASSASLPGSISNAFLALLRPQVAAVGGVADQRLVALLQLPVEAVDHRGAVGGVLVRLGLVAADDVAPPSTTTSLTNSWVSPLGPLDQQRRERALVRQHHLADQLVAALAGAEDVSSSPRSSRAARVAAAIMPRSATTQTRPMPKRWRSRSITGSSTLTSAVLPGHISEQIGRPSASMTTPTIICCRSGRWSLEWPRAPRVSPPSPVKDSEVVSRNTTLEIAEQVAPAREQRLLDQVLDGAGCERGGVPPAPSPRQLLAEPGHGAVEVVQVELLGAGDGVVGPATSRRRGRSRETMIRCSTAVKIARSTGKPSSARRPAAPRSPPGSRSPATAGRRPAVRRSARVQPRLVLRVVEGGEQQDLLAEPGAGGEEGREPARGGELVEASEGGDDLLADAAALAAVLDDLQKARPPEVCAKNISGSVCGVEVDHENQEK